MSELLATLLAQAQTKVPKRIHEELLTLSDPEEAKKRLKVLDDRYEEIEGEIEELETEKSDTEHTCWLLEEILPKWEAALTTPEGREEVELLAAVNNPNQMHFEVGAAGAGQNPIGGTGH